MNDHEMNALDKYLKLWKKIPEQMQRQLSQVLEAPRSREMSLLSSYRTPDLSSHTQQIVEYQKILSGMISPAFKELKRSLRELSPKVKESLLLLVEHVWYVDFNMPQHTFLELIDVISDGKIAKAENVLEQYYEDQLKKIECSISNLFPHRSHIIGAAIKAHRNGEYYLSIPVLLAQADGICKEAIGQYLFMKENKKPKTASHVEQILADTYEAALLSPLAVSTPIAASKQDRGGDFSLLNRHMVLHGESLDYGNKVNSLKAISLINYVSQALKQDTEHP